MNRSCHVSLERRFRSACGFLCFRTASGPDHRRDRRQQLDGILTLQSGTPFSPGLSITTNGLATRPDVVAGQDPGGLHTVQQWFNTAAFVAPAYGHYGNAGRNILRGPAMQKWDAGLFKNFHFRERLKLQIRCEAFNALNHTNLSGVSASVGSTTYGQVTSARVPRYIQLGAKLEF
jgi:hypothetical protein